jgi:hypothetical protein
MGKGKIKRLVPPGKCASKLAKPVTSLKLARKLTTSFHALLAQRERAAAALGSSDEARKAELKRLDAEIAAMGGREAYQEASALSTKVRAGAQPLAHAASLTPSLPLTLPSSATCLWRRLFSPPPPPPLP